MKNIVKLLIFVILVGCIYDDNQPLKSGRVMASVDDPYDTIGKTNSTNVQTIGGVYFIGQVRVKTPDPEGDTLIWSMPTQTTPGAFAITHRFGYIHVVDPELAKGKHLITVRLTDVNDSTSWTEKVIPVFFLAEDDPLPTGCDTIISRIDSTWIPGYWLKDTLYFKLVPSCYDTIPLDNL